MLTSTQRALFPPHASITWEETPCPLCGRNESTPYTEAPDPAPVEGPGLRFAIVRCRSCSLAYTNPRPCSASISRFYPADYRPHEPRPVSVAIGRPSWWRCRAVGHPCPERRGILPRKPPGRLLDFGCGGGSYLSRMAALGWQVAGLDSSPDAVRNVREQLGLEAYLGSLPHPALAPCSFEVVTMWHALEHVHQPLRILREAYRLLVPGGCLVVAVPNFDSHTRAWFGEHWFGLDLPRHLTHFTAETLGSMLLAAGFQVRTLRGLSHAGWVRASARRACAAGVGGVRGKLLRRRPVARMAAWLNYLSSGAESLVAVCERTS